MAGRAEEHGRRTPLFGQVLVSILAVTLSSVLLTGLLIRLGLVNRFALYLDGLPEPRRPGAGMGRMIVGAAEQSFITAVDRRIVLAALLAIVLAAVAAFLIARRVALPIGELTDGARRFAAGDIEHRVAVDGPAEVVELSNALNEMAGSLSEAERLRRQLVADVAHELRNPVAALRAQLEGVADGVIVMDARRAASLADDAHRLSRLVEDLQELSIAEAGRLTYTMAPFDLVELLRAEVDRLRPVIGPGVEVSVDAPAGSFRISGDELRIGQVARNLLGNAARHTPSGSITVAVLPADGGVRVEVRDTGEGIPPADLPYIFERFYRADSARASDTGGAGIGLAVARRIVQDHGGEVFATSLPGSGTTVGFELPMNASGTGLDAD